MNRRVLAGPRLLLSIFIVLGSLFFAPGYTFAATLRATTVHIVAWGETLFSIATRYGVSVDDLRAANNLSGDEIYAGQELVISSAANPLVSPGDSGSYVVQPGDTLFRIAAAYGLNVEDLIAANSLEGDTIYTGMLLSIPTGASRTGGGASSHVVQAGETLYAIGQLYGVGVPALVAANNLVNAGQIYVGQRLVVPGAATAAYPGYTPVQSSVSHVVQSGETLASIGSRYGVSVWLLAQVNSISNPSLLFVGQVLTIPNSAALSNSGPVAVNLSTKSILVDVSDQRTYAYEDGALKWTFVVSTGLPGLDTWRGEFAIQNKILMAYAATWNLQMPYWLGFYWAGPLQNGFHALPILPDGSRLWSGLLGQPASYGCVILSEEDASLLYWWVEIGTPVTVRN